MVYLDTYADFDGKRLSLGNQSIGAEFSLGDGVLFIESLQNKKSGYCWTNQLKTAFFSVPTFPFSESSVTFDCEITDNDGLTSTMLVATFCFVTARATVCLRLSVFPKLPFFKSELSLDGAFGGRTDALTGLFSDGNENAKARGSFPDTAHVAAVSYSEPHVKIKSVSFFDSTDTCNSPVEEKDGKLYRVANQKFTGDLFLLDAYMKKEGLLFLKEAPTHAAQLGDKNYDLLTANDGRIYLAGCGLSFDREITLTKDLPLYSGVLGVGEPKGLLSAFKKYYLAGAAAISKSRPYSMSNTWGDRSRDTAVCEAFILREIEIASALHVDVLQIDDGWQKGITANSGVRAGGTPLGLGVYDADKDFWSPRRDRFPNGLTPICEKARLHGVKLGLWFACDAMDDYKNWRIDADTLLSIYHEYGISYFKLDGIRLDTMKSVENLTALLRRVYKESGGNIHFNMDITAGRRFGYFFHREFGNLFVENRYTDWGNYYPHDTLRNLWQLSRYLPAQKLQLELLNLRRNPAVYGEDPLAPLLYSEDYAFATVMLSNPLFWMELSGLSTADADALAPISSVFRSIAPSLSDTIVEPIGDLPDGKSFTGLLAKGNGRGYILLFRELTEDNTHLFPLPLSPFQFRVLYQTNGVGVEREDGGLRLSAESPRSFVLLEYQALEGEL